MSDDVCLKVVELYLNEKKRGAAGGNLSSRCVRAARETSYQWKAERCMADENCFKVRGGRALSPTRPGLRGGAPTTGRGEDRRLCSGAGSTLGPGLDVAASLPDNHTHLLGPGGQGRQS